SENNPNNVPFDTSIVTPPISATSLHGATTLRYKANYREYEGPEALDLDITTDGGTTWTTIRHWTTSYGGFLALPGVSEQLDIGSYLPSSGDFQLRWRYYSPGGFVEYAMIDDVEIGACDPVPGGLVMGQVSDANSGNGILGAHVADGNGTGSDTVENYSDPNLPVGFYLFFDAAGQHTLSASAYNNYASQTAGITLNNNSVVMQNFALKSAQLGVAPGQFTLHVMVNSSATASFALSNTGSASGQYSIVGINAPMPATQESPSAAMSGGTPVIRKPVTNSDWIKGSLMWAEQQAQSNGSIQPGSVQARTTTHVPSSASVGSAWQALAPYPKGGDEKGTDDNTVARDPVTGKLYSMGGNYLYSNTIGIDSTAYVYDPKTDVWSRLPDAPVVRDDGASAFINGKYYVVDGWSGDATASPIAEMDIYDPSTDQWTTGAPDPLPVGGGAGYATLNGSLYIVGGCDNGACQGPSSAVQVYHPYSNSWTQVANYPHTVRFPSCGAIEGMLYCAGGIRANSSGSSVAESDAYVYDPLSNSWSHIAPMFVPLGESLYSAANGLLMVAGGIDGSANLVNETEAYDPQTNSWMSLPNLPGPIMRGGYACGFYQIGGVIGYSNKHSVLTKVSRVLPGYTQGCGILPKASWLTTAPASGTVQAGSSANITFTVDGTGQKANTSSRAYLSIANKSPYGPINVPVTVDWDPQPVALKVSGTADPGSAQKGTNVTFDFTVTNEAIKGDGAATETVLTVVLPASMNFVKEQGSSCSSNAGMVICPIDDLAQGDKTDVVIVAQANAGGAYQVTATATANEPQDSSVDNTTTVSNKAQAKAQTSSSGGGSLGLPILVLLLGLAVGVGRRRRPSR
ncbi:MAG: kelch repeat-containing protein, partial [Gammaproteobacteria bacterium]